MRILRWVLLVASLAFALTVIGWNLTHDGRLPITNLAITTWFLCIGVFVVSRRYKRQR